MNHKSAAYFAAGAAYFAADPKCNEYGSTLAYMCQIQVFMHSHSTVRHVAATSVRCRARKRSFGWDGEKWIAKSV